MWRMLLLYWADIQRERDSVYDIERENWKLALFYLPQMHGYLLGLKSIKV
jgi:hypothetical protein